MIFWRKATFPQKSEVDIMLVLNKSLQRVGITMYVSFSKIRYFQSKAIFKLLTKKFNMEDIIKNYLNILI